MSVYPMSPYEQTKLLQKEEGIKRISDLLVLAPQNDPFYMGQPSQVEKAQWFADIWNEFGFTRGIHIRRIHYKMISQPVPIKKPDGMPYENTNSDFEYLSAASKFARYLDDSIDPSYFVDRRNAEPVIEDIAETAEPDVTLRESKIDVDIEKPPLSKLYDSNWYSNTVADPYMIEIWAEKSTMNDIILPVTRSMNVNYVYGMGELSLTLVDDLVNRIIERGKPTRIFYISDFDPAGLVMPVSIARKIEFLGDDLDVRLFPLMLTEEQCIRYRLPRTPIKETDLRKKGFEDKYGAGATELDALEAIHPGEFRRILVNAINEYRQPEFIKETKSTLDNYREMIDDENQKIYDNYVDELEQAKVDWQAIQEKISLWKEKYKPVYEAINSDLEAIDLDDIELPEPDDIIDHIDPLFSTEREYMDQLKCYKVFQKKDVA